MKAIVEPYNKNWLKLYESESTLISEALSLEGIHHIGSTSIPGIYAKPIIDILGEASNLELVDANAPKLEELGYKTMGEFGITGRRYFRKDVDGVRKFHLHVFRVNSEEAHRHLRFRDFLRAHPNWAKRYSDLKQNLIENSDGDMDKYIDGKDAFIKDVDRRAAEWKQDLQTVFSWFDGHKKAHIRKAQTTYVEFRMKDGESWGPGARIHYNRFVRQLISRTHIKGSFKTLRIENDHILCQSSDVEKTTIRFHEGPLDGRSFLDEIKKACTRAYGDWIKIDDFLNDYFALPGNLERNTSGELFYRAPHTIMETVLPVLDKHKLKYQIVQDFDESESDAQILLMDDMYVLSAGFRAEIFDEDDDS